MNESEKLEFIGQIIDIFENYLDMVSYIDKVTRLNEDDVEERVWMSFVEKKEEDPWFADEDYFDIERQVREALENWGFFKSDQKQERCRDCAYLMAGDDSSWFCDDCGKEIHLIDDENCSAEQEF